MISVIARRKLATRVEDSARYRPTSTAIGMAMSPASPSMMNVPSMALPMPPMAFWATRLGWVGRVCRNGQLIEVIPFCKSAKITEPSGTSARRKAASSANT